MELRRSHDGFQHITTYDIRDLLREPNTVLRWSWENMHAGAQLMAAGFELWRCGDRKLDIAAELCRTHPDLGDVVRVLQMLKKGIERPPRKEEEKG